MMTKLRRRHTLDMHLETCIRMKLQTLYDVCTPPYLEAYKLREHAGMFGGDVDVNVTCG